MDVEAKRRELAEMQERMAVLKADTTAEVEANWTSNWRNPELVALKVETRLSSNQEYRDLLNRSRDAAAALAAETG